MAERMETMGFKEHFIRKGDGRGGWTLKKGVYRMINCRSDEYLMPYGIAAMENGQVILVAGLQEKGEYRCVALFSDDAGETWGDARQTGAYGRPLTFGYLGAGAIVFGNELLGKPQNEERKLRLYFSSDYGKSWKGKPYPTVTGDGSAVTSTEGQVFSERDSRTGETRIWHLCVRFPPEMKPGNPFDMYLRQSTDFGESWGRERLMKEWRCEAVHNGKRVVVGVSEGSLIRARDGALVAAIRTDIAPRYWDQPHDDSLEGLGVTVSRDDGRTWSPVRVLFDAGRHHPTLTLMPDGSLVMTYIVRVDVRGGGLASYQRGCEAMVSRDNGGSWNVEERWILDEYEYSENAKWFNGMSGHLGSTLLPDGSILTAYGHYMSKGISLIKWKPE